MGKNFDMVGKIPGRFSPFLKTLLHVKGSLEKALNPPGS
jgi:hypothetical protein